MPSLMVRRITPELWQRVKASAKADGLALDALTIRLLELYVEKGLPALEQAATNKTP